MTVGKKLASAAESIAALFKGGVSEKTSKAKTSKTKNQDGGVDKKAKVPLGQRMIAKVYPEKTRTKNEIRSVLKAGHRELGALVKDVRNQDPAAASRATIRFAETLSPLAIRRAAGTASDTTTTSLSDTQANDVQLQERVVLAWTQALDNAQLKGIKDELAVFKVKFVFEDTSVIDHLEFSVNFVMSLRKEEEWAAQGFHLGGSEAPDLGKLTRAQRDELPAHLGVLLILKKRAADKYTTAGSDLIAGMHILTQLGHKVSQLEKLIAVPPSVTA